jgi:hypothetical protein
MFGMGPPGVAQHNTARSGFLTTVAAAPTLPAAKEGSMVRLYEAGTDRLCGTLTDRQFEILAEALEEDDLEDGDCPIDRDTIETLEEQGVEGEVLEVLRLALGDRAEAGIRCERS